MSFKDDEPQFEVVGFAMYRLSTGKLLTIHPNLIGILPGKGQSPVVELVIVTEDGVSIRPVDGARS